MPVTLPNMPFFHFFATLPDILFPFGDIAPQYWRFLLHAFGAMLIVTFLWLLSRHVARTFIILLGIACIFFFAFQEFYLHPTIYGQSLTKGIVDFFTWVVPIIFFLLFYLYFKNTDKTR